jgi:uncharacterized membrane protein
MSVVGIIVLIAFLILFQRKKNIYRQNDFTGIPEDCTPAIAALITGILSSTNVVYATILDLMRKGYLSIDDQTLQSYNTEFVVTKVKNADETLLSHEKYFLSWLFGKMGDGSSVSTRQIENYSKNYGSKFLEAYNLWKSKVKTSAIQKGYYDTGTRKYGTAALILSVLLFITAFAALISGSLSALLSFLTAIALLIDGTALFYRLSDYGYGQYQAWRKFVKYMKVSMRDNSFEELQKTLDIELIYAFSLGIIKKQDNTLRNSELYTADSWLVWYLIFAGNDDNAFKKSIDHSFSSIAFSASEGSFSGGGDGGAGGGGAGGF